MTIANPTQGLDRRLPEAARGEGYLERRLTVARRALQLIFTVAIVGVGFSGVLTYRELDSPVAVQCGPLGDPSSVFGQPPCVYGLIMYSVIALVARLALTACPAKRAEPRAR